MYKAKIIFSVLSLVLFFETHAQDTLSVRDVFNFNIGDLFHYEEDASHYLPGGFYRKVDRITIISKYYSANSDTLYYERAIEGYTENLVPPPSPSPYPYEWKYYFHSYEDVVFYTHLDSSILSFLIKEHFEYLHYHEWGQEFLSDTLIYYSESLCNRNINGYHFSGFDEDIVEYGEGLGVTKISKSREECMCDIKDVTLLYFKKGADSCGTSDDRTNTGVFSAMGESFVRIYPNPIVNDVNIEVPTDFMKCNICIFDITGSIQYSTEVTGKKSVIDLSLLQSGVYYLKLSISNSNKVYRIVKL